MPDNISITVDVRVNDTSYKYTGLARMEVHCPEETIENAIESLDFSIGPLAQVAYVDMLDIQKRERAEMEAASAEIASEVDDLGDANIVPGMAGVSTVEGYSILRDEEDEVEE